MTKRHDEVPEKVYLDVDKDYGRNLSGRYDYFMSAKDMCIGLRNLKEKENCLNFGQDGHEGIGQTLNYVKVNVF